MREWFCGQSLPRGYVVLVHAIGSCRRWVPECGCRVVVDVVGEVNVRSVAPWVGHQLKVMVGDGAGQSREVIGRCHVVMLPMCCHVVVLP